MIKIEFAYVLLYGAKRTEGVIISAKHDLG